MDPYLDALKHEVRSVQTVLDTVGVKEGLPESLQVDSVYLGGGTPSFIPARQILELIDCLQSHFEILPEAEITLEVNPGSVSSSKIRVYQEAGINRISLGMQAFQDEMLQRIGRSHTVEEGLSTLAMFREAGFENISLDAIAGLPGQSAGEWQETLERLQQLGPEHISVYLLEVHENTMFGRIYGQAKGEGRPAHSASEFPGLPDEELLEHFYLDAVRQFSLAGYHHYEISNFCRPGYESRHNLKYWTDQPYLGFGCSSCSYVSGWRWGNERSPSKYVQRVRETSQAVESVVGLSETDRQEEAIFLGLRVIPGLDLRLFQSRFGYDFVQKFSLPIHHLADCGLLESSPERVRLTPRGALLSNEVFTELMCCAW